MTKDHRIRIYLQGVPHGEQREALKMRLLCMSPEELKRWRRQQFEAKVWDKTRKPVDRVRPKPRTFTMDAFEKPRG